MFPTKTILLTSKKKRYACNLKFEYLLDKNNQRVIKIVPKMEITNKSSTNQKNPVYLLQIKQQTLPPHSEKRRIPLLAESS